MLHYKKYIKYIRFKKNMNEDICILSELPNNITILKKEPTYVVYKTIDDDAWGKIRFIVNENIYVSAIPSIRSKDKTEYIGQSETTIVNLMHDSSIYIAEGIHRVLSIYYHNSIIPIELGGLDHPKYLEYDIELDKDEDDMIAKMDDSGIRISDIDIIKYHDVIEALKYF